MSVQFSATPFINSFCLCAEFFHIRRMKFIHVYIILISVVVQAPTNGLVQPVELISLLPYDLDVAPALIWTEAAFEVAVEDANLRYAGVLNFSLRLLYNTSHKSCADIIADSDKMMADYYYGHTVSTTVYGLVASSTVTVAFSELIQLLSSNFD